MPVPVLAILYVLFPVLVIWLCHRFPAVNKVGPVVLCYIAGITLGNVGVMPGGALAVQERVSEVSVALALPLLLFSMDVRRWFAVASRAILSMLLAVISIVVVATVGALVLLGGVEGGWKVAGLAVGVYTGGTPNLAAIKAALDVDSARFIVVHTYDTVVSIFYIIFCVTVARRVFLTFLPPFRSSRAGVAGDADLETEDIKAYGGMFRPATLLPLSGALLVSAAIVGLSVLVSGLAPERSATTVAILSITTLAIAASFVGFIRRIEKTFQLGMYIIYVFCFTVGSMANARMVVNVDASILAYITLCIAGSMALHALLCRLLRVDADTFIITSVSAICSPPFVPVVAGALGNRMVVLSGLTTGIIGYAVGNYLGISIAYLVRWMGG